MILNIQVPDDSSRLLELLPGAGVLAFDSLGRPYLIPVEDLLEAE